MWTIGRKSEFGTHNANMIYDENGNAILQVFGIASNCMLKELSERDADGLAIARQVVNDHNTIAALREAGEKMKQILKYVNDMNKKHEEDLDDDWLWAQNSNTGKKILTALAEWEAANK